MSLVKSQILSSLFKNVPVKSAEAKLLERQEVNPKDIHPFICSEAAERLKEFKCFHSTIQSIYLFKVQCFLSVSVLWLCSFIISLSLSSPQV